MSTLFIARESNCTVYYYGYVMVMMYDKWPYDEEIDRFHTHSLTDGTHAEENNRIMWEKW